MSTLAGLIVLVCCLTVFTLAGRPIPESVPAAPVLNPFSKLNYDSLRFDDWIMCVGAPPPLEAGWPVQRPRSVYTSNQQLCSKVGGAQYNLGCVCSDEGRPATCSLLTGADPILYFHRFNPLYTAGEFLVNQYCTRRCACVSEFVANTWQRMRESIVFASRFKRG